jgi:hypothetical protein
MLCRRTCKTATTLPSFKRVIYLTTSIARLPFHRHFVHSLEEVEKENPNKKVAMRSHGVVAGLVVSGAALINAGTVHITSYAGTLTTVQLDTAEDDFAITRAAFQTPVVTAECGANPGWLTLAGDVLYCLDEGFGKSNGSLTSFSVGPAGQLTLLSNVSTVAGPVSAVVYGEGGKGLAIAG